MAPSREVASPYASREKVRFVHEAEPLSAKTFMPLPISPPPTLNHINVTTPLFLAIATSESNDGSVQPSLFIAGAFGVLPDFLVLLLFR